MLFPGIFHNLHPTSKKVVQIWFRWNDEIQKHRETCDDAVVQTESYIKYKDDIIDIFWTFDIETKL